MKMAINYLPIDKLSYRDFVNLYLKTSKPLVIKNVFPCDQQKPNPAYVKKLFLDENSRNIGWFDSPLIDDKIIKTPEIAR